MRIFVVAGALALSLISYAVQANTSQPKVIKNEILVTNYKAAMKSAPVWLEKESLLAEKYLLENISPDGTANGVVIASPQKQNPNYFRHWVRDAALTMDVVLELSSRSTNYKRKAALENLLIEYARFSRSNQQKAGLGEPIFEIDGSPFLGPWGRPQNDGPALRAIVLIKWANQLLATGQKQFVENELYSSDLPAKSLIKKDLEYISKHWNEPCFDLWEEVKAKHFYTKMVQHKALLLGAQFARRMNDPFAADWYEKQSRNLEQSIFDHFTNTQGILASLEWTEGLNSKSSNLDVAVLLGILHGNDGTFINFTNPSVEKTFFLLKDAFLKLYPINNSYQQLAPAFGRYPEDIYAGSNFDGGNPWVLATLAAAEYSYKFALEVSSKNRHLALRWRDRGDSFVQRVQFHSNPDGTLSEQIDRFSGYMSSAQSLTWNYSAVLTTFWARSQLENKLKAIKVK